MATKTLLNLRAVVFNSSFQFSRNIQLHSKSALCGRFLSMSCVRQCSTEPSQLPGPTLHVANALSLTSLPVTDLAVSYRNGLPVFTVPLPSRRELCQFTMRPLGNTLGDFADDLLDEDQGIDRVAAYMTDGSRIARSTSIDILLQQNFILVINDDKYHVQPPTIGHVESSDQIQDLSAVKTQVAQLYSCLNINQHQLANERQLIERLESLKQQREPLHKLREECAERARSRTKRLSWLGLGMMSLQFGVLARLTWWEYSWDIMEPVTYFITYGTSMAMFAYYVLTKQEYAYPDVRDREFLLSMHSSAKKANLDIAHYNSLCDAISQTEYDLKRLRDPLQLQLPIPHVDKDKAPEEES